MRRIVYPDANETIAELMSGSRLERIREAGEFAIHIGRPQSDAAMPTP